MNNQRKEEIPLVNIERNPLVLLISVLITAGLVYLTFQTIFNKEAYEVNPLGFFLFVPTLIVFFQTMWYLVNPFAIIFEDKLEVKKSLFQNKFWHYVDIKKVGALKDSSFKIVYNDDEVEKISLFGIRASHKGLLLQELSKQVDMSLKNRPA